MRTRAAPSILRTMLNRDGLVALDQRFSRIKCALTRAMRDHPRRQIRHIASAAALLFWGIRLKTEHGGRTVVVPRQVKANSGFIVARPREFDEAEALEAAMCCFWAKGYEATSTRELAEQMGLAGASLYNAFGDKRSLYRRALDHYLQQSVHERVRRLEATKKPLPAIRAFFAEIIERSVTDRQRRGCMLVNSALEVAPHDNEIRKVVSEELIYIESFFADALPPDKAMAQ